jgi:hypothetical protein
MKAGSKPNARLRRVETTAFNPADFVSILTRLR